MKKTKFKAAAAASLSALMAISVVPAVGAAPVGNPYEPVDTVTFDGATFGRATEAYNSIEGPEGSSGRGAEEDPFDMTGMPLFNGNEDDIDEYIDLLLTEIGPEGWLKLAGAGSKTTGSWEGGTYDIPGGYSIGGEALQGVPDKTELSTTMHAAQSWDKELINSIGQTMSKENRGKQPENGYFYVSSTGTSMTDMRLNPLSGRYDEGYGEDPYMASVFADLNARGYNGYGVDETGLYELGQVQTKHYSVYNAQFFRQIISTKVGARSFYEYNAYSANRGFMNGTITSFMSSYGRINGIPSSGTFITSWADSISKYGAVFNGPDAGATGGYAGSDLDGRWGNGYDTTYSPSPAYAAASMLAAGHRTTADAVEAVANGLNGVTIDNAKVLAKAYLLIRTRAGIFDERDENGMPKYYPFTGYGSDGDKYQNESSEASQAVALQNAREGIVLLKNNDNVLPVSSDANLGIYGVFGNAVNGGYYAVVVPDTDGDGRGNYEARGQYAGLTPYEVIDAQIAEGTKAGSVSFDQGLNCVTIQNGLGQYLYVDAADNTTILVKDEADFNADDMGFYFAILDNGQVSHSIYSYGSGNWVRVILSDACVTYDEIIGNTGVYGADNSAEFEGSVVRADDVCSFVFGPSNGGAPSMKNNYPYNLTMEPAENEGEFYIRAGAKLSTISYITGVSPMLYSNYGFYLECQEDGTVQLGGGTIGDNAVSGIGLRYLAEKEDKSALTFKVTEVAPYGYTVSEETINGDDYAVLFVGQNYMTLSGEGTDRISLEIGESQIKTLENIAAAYKAAGKKTIAVIYASYPVVAEALQNNDNIDAILFSGYGGQYGSRAFAEVLYGDYAPTGRLVSTWYKDIELFPEISEYSVPKGDNLAAAIADDGGILRLDVIDPNIVVDMTNSDVIDTGLTYLYLTDDQIAEHVTYPFGYGLSYSSFEFANLQIPEAVNGKDEFTVSVDVTNTGDVTTSEVVQLYAHIAESAYGDAVPVRKLVSFDKVEIPAGETVTVELKVEPVDFAVWDVNAEDYVVESGTYTFTVSDSSDLASAVALSAEVAVEGQALASIGSGREINIWEHSFDSANVRYDEYSKVITAAKAAKEGVDDDVYTVFAEADGAWTAIPAVDLTGVTKVTANVGAPAGVNGTISLRIDGVDGEEIAVIEVAETGEATVKLAAATEEAAMEIHELGYNTVESAVTADGVHDLYIVFNAKDLHAATITLE